MKNTEKQTDKEPQGASPISSIEYTDKEIDLWQLFIPLVKYKVQIILFVVVGFLVGYGYKKNARNHLLFELAHYSHKKDFYIQSMQSAENEKSNAVENIHRLVGLIPDNRILNEYVALEYLYPNPDFSEKVEIIKVDEADWITPNKLIQKQRNYQSYLIIERAKAHELKQRLLDLIHGLEQQRFELSEERIQRVKLLYMIDSESALYDENENQYKKQLKILNASIKSTILGMDRDIASINRIIFSISEDISFEYTSTKIPLNIWLEVRDQLRQGKNTRAKHLFDLTNSSFKNGKEAMDNLQQQLSRYLEYINNVTQMKELIVYSEGNMDLEGYSIDSIKNIEYQIPKVKLADTEFFNEITPNSIIIYLSISFFIGVFTVYIRVMVVNLWQIRKFDKEKRELIEALKFLKL